MTAFHLCASGWELYRQVANLTDSLGERAAATSD